MPDGPAAGFSGAFKIRTLGFAWIDPKTAKPHPLNPKIHGEGQMRELKRSMDEFGWIPSMLGLYNRRTGRVIDAHGRRQAAIESGAKMPVAIVDVDEKAERRILASLDRVGEMRDVNFEALEKLLADVQRDSGEMPPGYDAKTLDQLREALKIPGRLPPALDVSALSKLTKSVTCPKCGHEFKA